MTDIPLAREDEFAPDGAVRPGVLLRYALGGSDMSPAQLAALSGADVTVVEDVITGSGRITPPLAALFGGALGTSAAFWMNTQARYDAALALGAVDAAREEA